MCHSFFSHPLTLPLEYDRTHLFAEPDSVRSNAIPNVPLALMATEPVAREFDASGGSSLYNGQGLVQQLLTAVGCAELVASVVLLRLGLLKLSETF